MNFRVKVRAWAWEMVRDQRHHAERHQRGRDMEHDEDVHEHDDANHVGHEPATIEDIFYGDWTPRPRSWVSPPTATLRRRYEEDQMWSGTLRNESPSVNPML